MFSFLRLDILKGCTAMITPCCMYGYWTNLWLFNSATVWTWPQSGTGTLLLFRWPARFFFLHLFSLFPAELRAKRKKFQITDSLFFCLWWSVCWINKVRGFNWKETTEVWWFNRCVFTLQSNLKQLIPLYCRHCCCQLLCDLWVGDSVESLVQPSVHMELVAALGSP